MRQMKEMEDKLAPLDDVAIAPIAPEHIDSFHRGLDLVARERKYLDISDAGPFSDFRDYIVRQISNGDPFFVALARGEVVGWCDVERHTSAANVHSGTLNIALIPRFRDRGLGFRLISATLEQARRVGLIRIQLFVHADNPRAIALYRKVGFVEEGLLRDAARIDGNFRDSLLMAKVDHAKAVGAG
jgi:RimJ/RimL family protein N-acetyltransferase